MAKIEEPIIHDVMTEKEQGHLTRHKLFISLERELKRPVLTYFTSFNYPVMIDDRDADMIEGVLQKMDLSNGLILIINSPGGDGLAAERIINLCRNYSSTKDFWVIVPGKAKSAATMICFGASKIIMSRNSEFGPVDPQLAMEDKRFSALNVVKSYNDLFKRAVKAKGNLEPYLQQLANYDERDIKEFKSAISLAEDIAVRTLKSGMMKKKNEKDIREDIKIFLSPEMTKSHGRPIWIDDGLKCGLNIEEIELHSKLWKIIYELYIRTDLFVSTTAAKCIESKKHSYITAVREEMK